MKYLDMYHGFEIDIGPLLMLVLGMWLSSPPGVFQVLWIEASLVDVNRERDSQR